MLTLVMRLNYKCYWDAGALVHVFIVNGHMLTIRELEGWDIEA